MVQCCNPANLQWYNLFVRLHLKFYNYKLRWFIKIDWDFQFKNFKIEPLQHWTIAAFPSDFLNFSLPCSLFNVMKIALAQLNYHIGNFEGNFAKMQDAIFKAKLEQADLICFSELASCGYPPRDFWNSETLSDNQWIWLINSAKWVRILPSWWVLQRWILRSKAKIYLILHSFCIIKSSIHYT